MVKRDLSSAQAEMRLRQAEAKAKKKGGKGKMADAIAYLEAHQDPSTIDKHELVRLFNMNVHTAISTLYWFNFMRRRNNG